MVEPEIGKLLVELPLAVDRADHLRFHQVVDDFILVLEGQGIRAARLFGQVLQALLVFIDLHPQPFGGHVVRRVLIEQASGAEPQRRKLRKARIHHRIADIFRMKLRLNPVLEARFFDLLHLAGARAESQPVERVQDGFLFVQFADRKFAGEVRVAAALVTPARRTTARDTIPRRRGEARAQASVARDIAANSPEPTISAHALHGSTNRAPVETFRIRAHSTLFNFIRSIVTILNPERPKKFRSPASKLST